MTKREAMQGLALKHYPFKWKQAQRLAGNHHIELPYWARVRRLYLELGGLYIGQLDAKSQSFYFQGAHHA